MTPDMRHAALLAGQNIGKSGILTSQVMGNVLSRGHHFDPLSCFCVKCGAAEQDIENDLEWLCPDFLGDLPRSATSIPALQMKPVRNYKDFLGFPYTRRMIQRQDGSEIVFTSSVQFGKTEAMRSVMDEIERSRRDNHS